MTVKNVFNKNSKDIKSILIKSYAIFLQKEVNSNIQDEAPLIGGSTTLCTRR